ncbi:MAG: AAA family ATPase [Culicoidibacterales bacterium]
MELIVTVGVAGSGKSTYAENLVRNSKGKMIQTNRDLIRAQLFGGKYNFSKSREKLVTDTQECTIRIAAANELSIIVSDTNLRGREKLKELASELGMKYREVWFLVGIQELLERNSVRQSKAVPEEVIRNMFDLINEQFGNMTRTMRDEIEVYSQKKAYKAPAPNDDLPSAVIFDLDGTLALMHNRGPYDLNVLDDLPNTLVIRQALQEQESKKLIFMSGRTDNTYDDTKAWLERYGLIVTDNLFMRKTGDMRGDVIVKQELFDANVANKYNVWYAMDDRNCVAQAWRAMGLTCWQVANGDF